MSHAGFYSDLSSIDNVNDAVNQAELYRDQAQAAASDAGVSEDNAAVSASTASSAASAASSSAAAAAISASDASNSAVAAAASAVAAQTAALEATGAIDGLRTDLEDDTDDAKGAGIIGYKGRNVNAVLSEVIRIEDYYAITLNQTAAMQAAAAVAQGKVIQLPAGSLSFTDTISLPHPCQVKGKGKGITNVTFTGMGGFAGKDGFSFQEGTGWLLESGISDLTIIISGAHGKTAIATPRGNTVWNLHRPTYSFTDIVLRGDVMNVDVNKQVMYDYGWQTYIDLGDGVGHVIENVEAYGVYDWTQDPAGQNVTARFINASCVQNLGGMLQPRIQNVLSVHVPIGLEIGYRVSQMSIEKYQFHRAWIGIYSPFASAGGGDYSTLESFFGRGNINAQRYGILMNAAAFLDFEAIRVSRASGGFDHAFGWTGWDIHDITQINVRGQNRSSNLGTYTGTHVGYVFEGCSEGEVAALIAENVTDGLVTQDNARITFVNPIVSASTNGVTISGTHTDCHLERPRFSTVTNDIIYSGATNRSGITIRRNNRGIFDSVDSGITAIAAAGTTTLTYRTDNSVKRLQANTGAGPYTHNIDFSNTDAIQGDVFHINLATVASSNPTVVFRDGSGITLVSINNISGVAKRYSVSVVFTGANWRVLHAAESLALSA